MVNQSHPYRGTSLIVITASLVIILWGINMAQEMLVLFLVACFLAVLGTVPVEWMRRKGMPLTAAVSIVILVMVVLVLGTGVVVGASLNSFSNALPEYQTRAHDLLASIQSRMAARGFIVTDKVLMSYINPTAVMNATASLFSALGSVLSNILIILFTVMFILLESASFPAKLRAARNNPDADISRFESFVNDIQRYMFIKTVINLCGAALVTIWLYILGVDFPILWGFLSFLLHYIPSLGSIVSAVPAVLLAYIQLGGGSAILVGVGYIVIGTIIGNIVEPKVMGRKLGMSTLVVFVSLIFWGELLGVVGALLCVPLTMTVMLACGLCEETRWIATVLGPVISSDGTPPTDKKEVER